MLVGQSVAFLDIKRWLEKQIIASKKLAYDSEEILGRKDGFSEISSMLNDISTVDGMKFESALKEAINSYRWQIKNQKMEDSYYSHGKIRAYLATLDYIKKIINNKHNATQCYDWLSSFYEERIPWMK